MALIVLAAYWILGVLANWHITVVKPAGVRTSMFPFPIVSGQWVGRESILHCYARHRVDTDDSDSYVVADFYTMGVETNAGNQVDIHLPYATEADALAAASEVAYVLNLNSSGRHIDVRAVETQLTHPWFRRLLLCWSAIIVLAVYVAWSWK